MKKIIITVLTVCCMFFAFGAFQTAAFAAENEYVKSVKTLIGENGGSAQPSGSEWAQVGNYSAYNQAVEQIEDASQDDGGDMIFRSATNADNTELVKSGWGFSKHSETRSKACYDINGLVIRYYDNTSDQKFILFNENYGQLNSGRFFGVRFNMVNSPQGTNNGNVQLAIWYQEASTGSYTWDSNITWCNWSDYNYGNDYDYFSDPSAKYYKEGNSFKGTQNTLAFKLDENNDLCLYLNGKNMANLTALGVVSKVVSQCTDGMYVSFWGEGSNGTNAFKLTDMYNEVKEWSTGTPSGYTTTDVSKVESKISSTGANQFRNAPNATSYDVTYETEQYLGSMELKFTLSGEAMAENDVVTVSLGNVALALKKVTSTTAKLNATMDGKSLGEQEVPFYFTEVANVIKLTQLKDFTLSVNGTEYAKDLSALVAYEAGLANGTVKVGFKVESAADTVLTPVEYRSELVTEYDSVDGLTVTGENTVIKSDGAYYAVYNTQDGEFSVAIHKKALTDSIALTYRYGATESAKNSVSVSAGKLKFQFAKNGATTTLALFADGEKIDECNVLYDWSYTEKSFRFVNDGGYGYLLSDGESELMYVDKSQNEVGYEKIDAAVSEAEDGMSELTVTSEKGQGIFTFVAIDYYVETSIKAGWKAGGYGTPKFGYDNGKSTTLVFNGNSFAKDKEIVVDGFEMKVKTFYDESGTYNSPVVVISSASSWFSLDTLGTIMFSVEKAEGESNALFRARGSLGTDRYLYLQDFSIENWNWNNNKENEIKLNLSAEDVWIWTVNGKDYPAAEVENMFSEKYNLAYEDFATNAGTLQFDSGNGYIWKITSLKEVVYNVPPVACKVELKDSYEIGEEIVIDLNKTFTDGNGDVLTFSLVSGDAEIKAGKLIFHAESAGVYNIEVKADDGNGGIATLKLTISVKEASGSCSGGISASGTVAFALVTVALIVLLAIKRKKNA